VTCYHPLEAYQSFRSNAKGKREITFKPDRSRLQLPLKLPCGQCIGCRLDRSRQWALRCVHEASLYENNCFLTLTFDDENLPSPPSLDVRIFQLFMKRLRKKYGSKIRFFHCGEYGETFGRPHYHAIIFNHDFADKVPFKISAGQPLFTSPSLSDLWPMGFASIGSVSFESAAYVARYCLKKVTGDFADEYYERVDPRTGEVYQAKPEYTTMSRRPGIAAGWFDKFQTDVYPADAVVMRGGIKMLPPKFYDRRYEALFPADFARLKKQRLTNAKAHAENNTPKRLAVREFIQQERLGKLPRTVDKGS